MVKNNLLYIKFPIPERSGYFYIIFIIRMTTITLSNQRKIGFWHFQIIGWIAFECVIHLKNLITPEFYGYIDKYGLVKVLIWWTAYDMVAFIITSGFRYFYRYLIRKGLSLWKSLLIAFLISAFFSVIWTIAGDWISALMNVQYGCRGFAYIAQSSTYLVSILFGWSVIYFGIKYWIQLTEEKARADKADLLAQSAQLKMLRYQMNPHFLFNSLNSIWALVDENQKASKEMISELAEFLRYTLVNKDNIEVTLRQELDAIKHYLSIEKKRFEEKLEVEYDIDPLTDDIPVMSFILHPLVENAVKYGMKTSSMPLKITISSMVEKGNLILSVTNSGKWIPPSENNNEDKTGTGIENIQLRLSQRFPGRFSLTTESYKGEVQVKLVIYNIVTTK